MTKPNDGVSQIKVSLIGSQPAIWRRLLIAPDTTFQDLHRIIQIAMGWQASHLHLFQVMDGSLLGDPEEDFDGMMNFVDEARVPVVSVLRHEGQALKYEYDFGDSWEHEITLEQILRSEEIDCPLPRCIEAERQGPPEDVGGLHGFYDFLEAMEDAAHPEHVAVREWWGEWFEPEFVDVEQINQALLERDALFAECGPETGPVQANLYGLSPGQVHELLQNPLNCPSVFRPLVSAEVGSNALDNAPIVRMARALIDAMGDKGIRLTGKGNLPLREVRVMIEAGGEDIVLPSARYGAVRSEEEVLAVNLIRLLLEIAGFTKKEKGRLLLKNSTATRLAKKGWLALYQDILSAALSKFNWAWMDHYEGMEYVQYIGPFCFWLLSEQDGQWLPVRQYLDDMLNAFPRLPLAAYPVSYASEEEQARWALRVRMIQLYRLLGLIELDPEHARFREEDKQLMRRTALFERMFVRA